MASPEQIKEAIKAVGFDNVIEVGLGADLTTMNEAKEFIEEVPDKIPFMGTSCCYSWKLAVEKNFPELNKYISDSSTPMVYTALQIKKEHPNSKVVFIGPCISKKLEALQDEVKEYVDFVITYEELMGMFIAKGVEPSEMVVEKDLEDASSTAREYSLGGGVAKAVVARVKEIDPERKVVVENADGLHECIKMLRLAKAGLKNGKLLEGMACSQGCVGGPGTIVPRHRSRKAVQEFAKRSPYKSPADNIKIPEEDKPL